MFVRDGAGTVEVSRGMGVRFAAVRGVFGGGGTEDAQLSIRPAIFCCCAKGRGGPAAGVAGVRTQGVAPLILTVPLAAQQKTNIKMAFVFKS